MGRVVRDHSRDCSQGAVNPARLTVVRDADLLDLYPSARTIQGIEADARNARLLREVFGYAEVTLLTHRLEVMSRPFATAALLRPLARRRLLFEDPTGDRLEVTWLRLGAMAARYLRDARTARKLRRDTEVTLASVPTRAARSGRPRDGARPVYVRTDLWYGLESGGSVGHVAGVVNELELATGSPPILLATEPIPMLGRGVDLHIVAGDPALWDFPEEKRLAVDAAFQREAVAALGEEEPAFIYQRYSLNSQAGLRIARWYGVPFVLEYNGSEVWIGRNWGRRLKHEALSERIELLNLRSADLVVVVSEVMREELLGRGVSDERILVNPNGVDPDRYRPDIDGSEVRRRYRLGERLVIGFIGTFGPWHGAEVLADAFGRLIADDPGARDRLRLLMIGDGPTLAETRRRIEAAGAMGETVFTGRTRQEDGPAHLAACDILVSPHVPNADGTRFFGSPTKLFEYMAMGRAIIASDLEQIGQVLDHDHTAWLVPPGDVDALVDGLRLLVSDPERRSRLGAAAREAAVASHTWREHTRRIIEALEVRCA